MSLSHQQKVYLPTDARTNQYISAEIKLTDALLSQYPDFLSCYQALAKQFFELADRNNLRSVHVIANDKLPVVRFHSEAYCIETDKQVYFFYNPRYHEAQNLFASADYRTRKIRFLFLAVGEELRANSANFHSQVQRLLAELTPMLKLEQPVTIRDHQHLTYDLFARSKGDKKTYGFKLRGIAERYKARGCDLPAQLNALSYATVTLPLARRLKQRLGNNNPGNYTELYSALEHHFKLATQQHGFTRAAMVANGLLPLVRNSNFDRQSNDKGVQMLGFDPLATTAQFQAYWQGSHQTQTAYFVIAAGQGDHNDAGFGRFLNKVEDALRQFSEAIDLDGERQDLIVRFNQHISYKA